MGDPDTGEGSELQCTLSFKPVGAGPDTIVTDVPVSRLKVGPGNISRFGFHFTTLSASFFLHFLHKIQTNEIKERKKE